MDFDLTKGLHELGHDPLLEDAELSVGPMLTRVHRRRTVRTAAVGIVGAAATAAIALGGATAVRHTRHAIAAPAATTTTTTTTTTAPSPVPSPSSTAPALPTATPTASETPPATTRPLKDTSTRFDGIVSIVSDTPNPEGPLVDGDYYGGLVDVDMGAGTVSFQISTFYGGAAAQTYLNGIGNDRNELGWVEIDAGEWEIPLAPTVTVHTWCLADAPPGLGQLDRDPAEWAAATGSRWDACTDEPTSQQGNNLYWFDVRGGEVVQIIGQYMP